MNVNVLIFGYLKETTGDAGATMSLPEGSRVADLLDLCAWQWPAIEPYFDVIAVALNEEYAERGAALQDGDRVALIPPVSGGAPDATTDATPHATPDATTDATTDAESDPEATNPDAAAEPKPAGAALLTENPIDVASVVAAMKHGADGAVVVFEGTVRNNTRGRQTLYLHYEAYEDMALKQMSALVQEALAEYLVRGVAVIHRLGRMEIGETSVLIVVSSAHRGAAFEASRWLIDTLKKKVPIWKKEYFVDGAVWADGEPFPAEIPRAGVAEPSKPASN